MSKPDWEDIGRKLLQKELERISEEVARDAFSTSARRLDRGEELRAEDIYRMRAAIDELQEITELAAEATQGVASLPDVWDVLDEEARSRYVQRAREQRLKTKDE
ncbi:hypothetical protein ACERIM_10750 [Natrinema sp. H-ect1]|uniref:hypothetical protein n=1 Tax=Natrinema sp. H-ect1 TaxID=3242700 RepID=UPI00359F0A8A